jgi:hypothetical protein
MFRPGVSKNGVTRFPCHPNYARTAEKFPQKVPQIRNFVGPFALAFDLQCGGQYPFIRPTSRKCLEKQGLNLRGSVDQIMKEVKKPGGLNSEIQSRIGHQLRAMYDDVVRQGVPDRFADLIRKLDGPDAAAEIAKKDGGE